MTKSIVNTLLAFAVVSSLAIAQEAAKPAAGGWTAKPGSGLKYDGGDEFSLKVAGQLQLQWAYGSFENEPNVNTFDVRRARIGFSGHAFSKDLMYLLKLDATDDGDQGAVKDAWVHWNFVSGDANKIGLRFGQSKTGHGLEATGSSTGLLFVERSLVTEAFTNERSRGAWIYGSHAENKFRWNAGAQNGDVGGIGEATVLEVGEETPNGDNELSFTANASFDLLGDMTGGRTTEGFMQGNLGDVAETRGTIGAGVFLGNGRNVAGVGSPVADSVDVEATQFNVNTAWAFAGGFSAQAEYFMRTDEVDTAGGADADTTGWYAQGGWTKAKSGDSTMQWGLGLRVSSFEIDDTDFEVMEIAGVVNAFYHGHAAKTQIEFAQQDWDAAGLETTDYIVRVQFQLLF